MRSPADGKLHLSVRTRGEERKALFGCQPFEIDTVTGLQRAVSGRAGLHLNGVGVGLEMQRKRP